MKTMIEELGYPLFFPVSNSDELGLDNAEKKLSQTQRVHIRSLDEMQKEALVTSSVTKKSWRLVSDEGPYLQGADIAPCPLSFLTTGMVSSYAEEILVLAKKKKITIQNLQLTINNFYTMKGSALRGTMTGGALSPELEVQISSDSEKQEVYQLVMEAVARSPINGLLLKEHQSLFKLNVNDKPVSTKKVAELSQETLSDPGDKFQRLDRNQEELETPIIFRTGKLTEKMEKTGYTAKAGSSLSDQQDRILHVQGICTLREDGVKVIEQKLFSPQGTIFRFLSDEKGEKAPDSASYMAAGIGFCFMTQFGRYAKIVKKDLKEYKIIQDTYFSFGGNHNESENFGLALPVETYVFLHTPEDDAFGQDCLDMAEQTCFLHAFCRTALKTKVKIAS